MLAWAGFKGATTYTFDDAQPSQIAHYAQLQSAGVPMTFYISSGNSYLASFDATFSQAVKDGHEMGNHTAHHCYADLTGCGFGTSAGSLAAELDQCTAYITQHFGQSAVWTAASPFGDTGYDTIDQTRFFLNRGVASGMIAPNDGSDPYNLPIYAASAGDTAAIFDGFIDTANASGKWWILLVHTISPTSDNWYMPVAVTEITNSMSHAKTLGTVWLDTLANVGAYWRGQKVFSAAAPTTSGNRSTWTWTLPDHFPPGKFLRVTVDGGVLTQNNVVLPWVLHGYYEVSLDAGSLAWSP